MPETPDFETLCELSPELRRVEAATRAVHDDGEQRLFCANNAWFAIKRRIDDLLGVWRRPVAGEPAELAEKLSRSAAYEVAFEHLYPLLPPCRACGCSLFQPLRVVQLREFRATDENP